MRIKMNGTIEQLRLRACGPNPLVSWSDEKLLLSYRSKPDNRVFEELVHRYEKELYGYLRHYLGDAEMAEDVFQQTFLQVHLKCDQFEPGRKVRPWLYTVATNQAIDCQRRNRRHRMSSLDRATRNSAEEENGTLGELLGVGRKRSGRERRIGRTARSTSPGGRCAARVVQRGGDAGVLPRTEVSRGGPGLGASRGNGQEPAARRRAEAHRIAFARELAVTQRWTNRMSDTDPMHQQLLGHLLGALDDDEQEWVEARLEHDEEYRRRWVELRRRLAPLLAVRPDFEPPPGLAERTCRLVASFAPVPRRAETVAARA